MFSTPLGKEQGGQLLGHMERVCLALEETATLSSKEAVLFCIPISNE